MDTDTATEYPLRVTRGTTGTVHAAREERREILDFNAPYAQRWTGKFETITVKACGHDSNTLRRISGVSDSDAAAEVTCRKCVKVLAR